MEEQLGIVAQYLKDNPNITLKIDGHSDNRGTTAQTLQRSQSRAKAASDFLISQGIPQEKII